MPLRGLVLAISREGKGREENGIEKSNVPIILKRRNFPFHTVAAFGII